MGAHLRPGVGMAPPAYSSRAPAILERGDVVLGRRKSVTGVEPIVGAALNAAWPWIEDNAFARILTRSSTYMRESTFAAARTIPILDVHTRTLTLFSPGELAKIDIKDWLDWRAIGKGALEAPGAPLGGRGVPGRPGSGGTGTRNPFSTGGIFGPGGPLGPGTPGHRRARIPVAWARMAGRAAERRDSAPAFSVPVACSVRVCRVTADSIPVAWARMAGHAAEGGVRRRHFRSRRRARSRHAG